MIKSQLLLDILDLIFDGLENEKNLRCQIPFLKENNQEHTGIGLFINLDADKNINDYKIPTINNSNKNVDGNPIERIDGLELINESQNILADISVHLTNGIIDCVEIWNKNGENYPKNEPNKYQLIQNWIVPEKRKTIVRN
ncbi:hypothetical protein [Flavobacterium suncheonense]|uniref:Uncharacterized protein n=1 Tax=Flavobacterium suncheonense GH29-5 = DSM 17707 TaxID=1121899 RepID=A0A0A2LX36_9FLAO|nr:hypothetical protein [Flavobacterium suncheonense]KGO84564.1 hypothetical protein Q764_14510 [Flavobacterium suncheonense GH29-5 = DSM 17707]